eukprot:Em0021g598a
MFQILMNAGIHSSLITFVALLMATGCLLLNDIISYIIKPIISVQAQLVRTLQNVRAMNQPQQQNQIFIQQPGLTVQRSQIFPPSEMDLYRQQQQQQLLRQQRMLQMRQQQQQQQQQQYQFRSQMRMVAPQSATPVQLQQQLMGQQGGFPAALGQGQQQQPPPPHQQGMMMRQQPAGQFTGPQQTAPGFMPGRMF